MHAACKRCKRAASVYSVRPHETNASLQAIVLQGLALLPYCVNHASNMARTSTCLPHVRDRSCKETSKVNDLKWEESDGGERRRKCVCRSVCPAVVPSGGSPRPRITGTFWQSLKYCMKCELRRTTTNISHTHAHTKHTHKNCHPRAKPLETMFCLFPTQTKRRVR